MMQTDASALRYVTAQDVAYETTCLGGFDVRDIAGDALGILDGLIIHSTSSEARYFVVEAHGWAARCRYLVPMDQAVLDLETRTLQLNSRGCKQLQKFAPELIIISAGFDAHYRDPLASLNLKADDFGWVTRKLMDQAEASAGGRLVSVLEGGYDLQGLKESAAAHVTALMGA
jgi:hypothetical protein